MLVGIIAGLLILVGTSYAWWTSTATQQGINEVQSSCIKVAIQNETGDIKLPNAYPLTDKQAEDLTPYQFTITNTCKTIVDYTVKLEKLMEINGQEDKLLNSKYIAVEFNGGQKELLSNYPIGNITYDGEDYISKEARELIKGTLNGTLEGENTKTYTLKLWMDESVTATDDSMNKSFISKIVVDGSLNELAVYNEPKLHGADPVLGNEGSKEEVAMLSTLAEADPTTSDKLIPVIIDNEGKVTRADLSHEWYNYEEKRWANAVILVDGVEEPDVGAEIKESDIESYFVWIPKYKYKIFDMGDYTQVLQNGSELPDKGPNTAIEIIFGDTDTTNTGTTNGESECESPNESGQDGQCAVGKWMTHPAFLAFGGNGLWVGKFETGYEGATSTNDAQSEEKTNIEGPDKVIIKPNVFAWRNISIGNAFKTSLAYQRKLDSHLMKNTEWGAVAYLTQSIYGRCADSNTCEEVRINNNSSFLTGYVAKISPTNGFTNTSESCTLYPEACNESGTSDKGKDGDVNYQYFNTESVKASTTNNYSGIYDMSGGSWEYVAGYMSGNVGQSDLKEETDLTENNAKYYDKYLNTSNTQYNMRILGDATGEMGPFVTRIYSPKNNNQAQTRTVSGWFYDDSWFIYSENPWFVRGGDCYDGLGSGIFTSFRLNGGLAKYTFRIVLAPEI